MYVEEVQGSILLWQTNYSRILTFASISTLALIRQIDPRCFEKNLRIGIRSLSAPLHKNSVCLPTMSKRVVDFKSAAKHVS